MSIVIMKWGFIFSEGEIFYASVCNINCFKKQPDSFIVFAFLFLYQGHIAVHKD